jgi:tRNA(fMet)-specific endonuclease VapC
VAYCLDTNTIVFCLRGKSAKAANRLRITPASEVRVPMQVLAELRVGAAKSAKPLENKAVVEAFVKPFALIWPDESIVQHYVAIRTALESIGQSISEADLWIAATARAHGDVMVTNNVCEFQRVPGLVVEDWSA